MTRKRRLEIRADQSDPKFSEPLYTIAETAFYLRRPRTSVNHWVKGRGSVGPLVTWFPDARREHAEVPFIGLAEAMIVSFLRRQGISMPKIRRGLDELQRDMTLDYALASRSLKTDGIDVFFRYAEATKDPEVGHLADLIRQQYTLDGILDEAGMIIVSFAEDGWAGKLVLPLSARPLIEVDPQRGFGKPLFVHGGAPLTSVLQRLGARESFRSVARDFDVPMEDLQEVVLAFIETTATAS